MEGREFFLKRGTEERLKGNFSKAIYFFNRYIEKGGSDPEIILWMADRYVEEGKGRKAVGFLKRMTRRLNYPRILLDRLATFLQEMGAISELEDFAKEIPYGDEFLRGLRLPLEGAYSDEDLMEVINLFSGREGVHARMWLGQRGRVGYSPVKAPLTPSILRKHLSGKYTVGVYQIKLNNTVKWVVFDLDISFKSLKDFLRSGDKFDKAMGEMLEIFKELKNSLSKSGISSYIEDSGFKGYHLWIFFKDPVNAGTAREFAEMWGKKLSVPPQFHLEIFPKQARVPSNGYGNLVKLPGGIHLKTGRRSFFLEEEDFLKFVKGAERIGLKDFKRRFWEMKREEGEKVPLPLSLEASEDFKILRQGCAVIDSIVGKILRLNPISSTEKKVLEHTVGHLEEGPAILEELYSIIGYKNLLKSPHRGNPISCARIKKELKYLTASLPCDCDFPFTDTYPNPLLHLRNRERSSQLEYLIRRFIFLKKQKKEVEEKIGEIERAILEKLGEGEEATTKYGRIKVKEGKIYLEIT